MADSKAQPDLISPETMAHLRGLQDLDTELARLESETQKKPGYLAAKRREKEAREADVEANKADVLAMRKIIDARTVESDSLQELVTKLEGQLFSLKSNDEFETMKRQIAAKKATDDEIQNKILEGMMAVDELNERQAEMQVLADKALAEFKKAKGMVAEELSTVKAEIAMLEVERQAAHDAITEDLREDYDHLRERRAGLAVVAVLDSVCKGCDTEVRAQDVGGVLGGRLVHCPHCNRILYLSHG